MCDLRRSWLSLFKENVLQAAFLIQVLSVCRLKASLLGRDLRALYGRVVVQGCTSYRF